MKKHLATLSTRIVEFHDPGEPLEGGVFEIEVQIDMELMRKSGTPKTYFFREIGHHLRHGIRETTVPKEYWTVRFSGFAQREFNLPELVSFAVLG